MVTEHRENWEGDRMTLFRTTIRLAAVMAVAGAALVATPQPAPGCSCARTATLSEYADEVDIAFTGRQIERVEPDGTAIGAAKVALILEVDRVYRGRTGPLISVLTNFGEGNCGIDFSGEGLVAVAPALRQDDDLEVALCGSQYAISDFQAVFGPGYPPDEAMTQTLEQMEKSARDTVNHLMANRDYITTREAIATTVLSAQPPPPARRAPAVALLIGTAAAVLAGGAVVLLRVRRSSEDRRR